MFTAAALPSRTARVALVLLILFGQTGCIVPILDFGSFGRTRPLIEAVIREGDGPTIAVIEIDGLIQYAPREWSFGSRRPGMPARVREALDMAQEDDDVAGLIVRIHSPGGEVSATESIYHELKAWKELTGKPVVAYLQGLATSGGYYIAMVGDELVAHPTCVTGSIGVVMQGINFSGLMTKLGVEDQTIASGAFKDSGSVLRPMRDEERAQLQSVIDDLHLRFVDVVEQGRGSLERETVETLADGRIYSASQALGVGLVDSIGHMDAAIEAAERKTESSDANVVVYRPNSDYVSNIYSQSPNEATQTVQVDVLSLNASALEPGFYYLWPSALGAH